MIPSFRTDMPGQTVQTQIRLLRIYTVCHSVCIVWTHYSMVEPHSSNFRVITTKFLCVRISRKFMVCTHGVRNRSVIQKIIKPKKQTRLNCTPLYSFYIKNIINEPTHDKTNKMTCMPNEDIRQSDQSSLCALWVIKDRSFFMWTAKTDQTGQMPRLIWVFAGCTCHFVGFVIQWLICTYSHFYCWFTGTSPQVIFGKIWNINGIHVDRYITIIGLLLKIQIL